MSLEKIYGLEPEESEILYSGEIDNQSLEVRQWEQYRWMHLGDSSVQSLINLDALDQVMLPNIQALLSTLLFCPESKRLLNLGLGGASLERYLDSKWPDIKLKSVESNEKIITLAENFFFLPEAVDVVHDTAEHFMANHSDSYDIILCDIFIADMQASCLSDNDFYANIHKCLDSKGVLAINILPESEEDVIQVLLPMKNHFNFIYLLEFDDYMNVIVFASNQKLDELTELNERAEQLFEQTELDLRHIPERLNVILETV